MALRGLKPGSHGYTRAIVAAQVLAQLGAFTLPALLPGYIDALVAVGDRGRLAGRRLLRRLCRRGAGAGRADRPRAGAARLYGRHRPDRALASRLRPAGRRILVGASVLRALAGIGWAGTYMPGLKAIADPLEGKAQSRAVTWHAAGVGIAGAASFAIAGVIDCVAGSGRGLPVRRHRGARRFADRRCW